jgi:hypothetical protein
MPRDPDDWKACEFGVRGFRPNFGAHLDKYIIGRIAAQSGNTAGRQRFHRRGRRGERGWRVNPPLRACRHDGHLRGLDACSERHA